MFDVHKTNDHLVINKKKYPELFAYTCIAEKCKQLISLKETPMINSMHKRWFNLASEMHI